MSGQVYDPGSVLEFTPYAESDLSVKAWRGRWEGEAIDAFRIWGWVRFVTERSGWAIKTEIQPAIWCCNAIRPAKWHMDEKDHGYGTESSRDPWEFQLEQEEFHLA